MRLVYHTPDITPESQALWTTSKVNFELQRASIGLTVHLLLAVYLRCDLVRLHVSCSNLQWFHSRTDCSSFLYFLLAVSQQVICKSHIKVGSAIHLVSPLVSQASPITCCLLDAFLQDDNREGRTASCIS